MKKPIIKIVLVLILMFFLTGIQDGFARKADFKLRVLATEPAPGAEDIPTEIKIKAYFNKKLNPDTINIFTMTVNDGACDIVGQVVYDEYEHEVTFIPASKLLEATTYRVKLSREISSIAGDKLEQDKVWTFRTAGRDVIRPVVAFSVPSPDSVNVPINTDVSVIFSEEMNSTNIFEDSIRVTPEGGDPEEGSIEYITDAKKLIFHPRHTLKYATKYRVEVLNWLEDRAGNKLPETYRWEFTTEPPPDRIPPEIIEVFPPDKAVDVPVKTCIQVRFSEVVLEADVNAFTFLLSTGGLNIPGLVKYDYKKKTAYFQPVKDLEYGKVYTAEIKRGIRDLAGNAMVSGRRWNFVTQEPPDVEPPKIISCTPEDGAINVPVNTEITMVFSEEMDEKTVNDFGFQLYLDDVLISGDIQYVKPSRKLIFTPKSNLEYGRKYLIMARRYLKDLSGNSLDRERSFIFRTEPPPDVYPPRVVACCPAIGQKDVELDTVISCTFDEPIKQASLNLFTFLVNDGKKNLFGEIEYDKEKREAVFKPVDKLQYETLYKVTVSDITDLKKNRMKEKFTWSFMTVKAPDTEPPEIISRTPEPGTKEVPIDTEIVVQFNEPLKPATVNQFTVTLSDGLKNLAGEIIYDENKYLVIFRPKEKLLYQKIYVVKLSKLITDLKGNEMKDQVSWEFTTVHKPDLEGPEIIDYSPSDGKVNVDLASNITVQFSEPVDARTLNPFTFKVFQGKKVIDGKITYFDDRCTAVFTPFSRFELGQTYTVEVTAAVRDLSMNGLKNPQKWRFTTISRNKVAGMDIASAYTYFETDPFPDVPKNHWAYNVVRELGRKGYFQGYPKNKFDGTSRISRYEVAMMVSRLMRDAEKFNRLDRYDAVRIQKLALEFSSELDVLGIRVADFRQRIENLEIEIAEIKKEVSLLKKEAAYLPKYWKEKSFATQNRSALLLALALLL